MVELLRRRTKLCEDPHGPGGRPWGNESRCPTGIKDTTGPTGTYLRRSRRPRRPSAGARPGAGRPGRAAGGAADHRVPVALRPLPVLESELAASGGAELVGVGAA